MTDETREPGDGRAASLPDQDAVARLLVASFPPVEPDRSVWTNIEAEISASPRLPRTARTSRSTWPWLMAIAAVAVLVVGIGAIMTRTAAPDVVAYDLTNPDTGAPALTIEVATNGSAVVSPTNLPDLPETQTYQLWAVVNDEIVSVGLLGSTPDETPLRVEGDPEVFALSIEVAGGVAVSEVAPVAVWSATG